MNADEIIAGLPGEALVRQGLSDLRAGRRSIPACLAVIAQGRLRRAQLLGNEPVLEIREPERFLYRLLRGENGDAYSRYNALLRELASFEQALDHRLTQRQTADSLIE